MVDGISPRRECSSSFCSGLGHGDHHPWRNFDRAGMAWITAVPSSSLTTPISSGSAFVAGPMYTVTSRSSVSKCTPVVLKSVEHVFVGNIVLAGARLDVDHPESLPGPSRASTDIDARSLGWRPARSSTPVRRDRHDFIGVRESVHTEHHVGGSPHRETPPLESRQGRLRPPGRDLSASPACGLCFSVPPAGQGVSS